MGDTSLCAGDKKKMRLVGVTKAQREGSVPPACSGGSWLWVGCGVDVSHPASGRRVDEDLLAPRFTPHAQVEVCELFGCWS